jgi:hypothetical protein
MTTRLARSRTAVTTTTKRSATDKMIDINNDNLIRKCKNMDNDSKVSRIKINNNNKKVSN